MITSRRMRGTSDTSVWRCVCACGVGAQGQWVCDADGFTETIWDKTNGPVSSVSWSVVLITPRSWVGSPYRLVNVYILQSP